MKKIFTLLLTMCIALCSYADELTFSVVIEGNDVTVTPSIDDQLYLFAPMTVEEVDEFANAVGREINTDTPEDLFKIARVMYKDNLFTGTKTLTCYAGDYYLLLCGAELNEEGKVIATTPITTQAFSISSGNNGGEDPDAEPLTFSYELDGDGFNITPSDDTKEYFAYAFTPEMQQKLQQMNLTVESYMNLFVSYGGCEGHTLHGPVHLIPEYFADEGEEIVNGMYLVVIMGVKIEDGHYVINTPVYQYEWPINRGAEGIHDILAGFGSSHIYNPGKLLKDGKIIINGRVNLNGTLVR